MNHEDYQDRLLDLALREKLSGHRPPDLSERILEEARATGETAVPVVVPIAKRSGETLFAYAMSAALLALATTAVLWVPSQLSKRDVQVASHKAISARSESEIARRQAQLAASRAIKQLSTSLHNHHDRYGEYPEMLRGGQIVVSNQSRESRTKYWLDARGESGNGQGIVTFSQDGKAIALLDSSRSMGEILKRRVRAGKELSERDFGDVGYFDLFDSEGTGPESPGDRYDVLVDNDYLAVADRPLSTFSIDVDTASYAKTRMFLMQDGRWPPRDAVRIEELINYFEYDYAGPSDVHPLTAHLEVAGCPWNSAHRLVRIGIQGKRIETQHRPDSNLVFLLDVSGSMDQPNKLPLVIQGMEMLVEQLTEKDRVAIVVYAGAAGLVLPSTTGDQQHRILQSLQSLRAGGSTNGGDGIRLAYQLALDHFIPGGVNRVILCTDGDFNVGTTSTGELVDLAEQHAKENVYLSVLGFGMGNHNDDMLEKISNRANGNYSFIDTDREARKVLVQQMASTLVTIAKDVKLQVEFNPRQVAAYRLIGYANRLLADRDFHDDTKDAGEIGAGHSVTALYEIVPAGDEQAALVDVPPVAALRYQKPAELKPEADSDELMVLRVRYKRPDEESSQLLSFPLRDSQHGFTQASTDFQFAAAVAALGMILRQSQYKGDATLAAVEEIAGAALGKDPYGYRQGFLELVRRAAQLEAASPAGP